MTEDHEFGPHKTTPSEGQAEAMGGCLTRIGWLVAAPLALLMLGAVLAKNGNGAWSMVSGAYWAVALATLGVRYLDIFRYKGQTTEGQPASKQDWRRYLVRFPALVLAGWAVALFVGET